MFCRSPPKIGFPLVGTCCNFSSNILIPSVRAPSSRPIPPTQYPFYPSLSFAYDTIRYNCHHEYAVRVLFVSNFQLCTLYDVPRDSPLFTPFTPFCAPCSPPVVFSQPTMRPCTGGGPAGGNGILTTVCADCRDAGGNIKLWLLCVETSAAEACGG